MVKWTEYCYKRWLWTFVALAELDVVVANINIQLTAFANIHHPWPEFELLGEGRSGPQTISAKTLEFQIRIRPSIV